MHLSESDNPLLGSDAATLDHDEVLLDLSVVRESTHGVDGLVGQVVIGGGIVLDQLKKKVGIHFDSPELQNLLFALIKLQHFNTVSIFNFKIQIYF